MRTAAEKDLPLWKRLWIYQGERIPLIKTSVLLSVFSAASINVSALLADRDLPGWSAYLTAFAISLILFIQLRACDEHKDGPDDHKYRPERPIPRGLVSLRTVLTIGAVLVPLAIIISLAYYPPVLVLLAVIWLWLALMTVEFFVPDWIKARPWIYLVSHMAIMPLLDLFVTGVEWLPAGYTPEPALAFFLILSFVNGCVLEIGRKTWAPENERDGVETYSGLWGVKKAANIWLATVTLSFMCLAAVGTSTGHFWSTMLPASAMLAVCWYTGATMRSSPTDKRQKLLDTVAGLWVFVCYTAAGFAPLVGSWMS
ncbi:MAG: UbiA family prenyltransferase [Pseudomonadota bacterium]